MMRGGKLDRTIVIARAAIAADDYGTPNASWATLATVRAQRVQASTEEFFRNFGASSETIIVYRIRWLDGLTVADRVTEGSAVFDIKEIRELGRRDRLELRCMATGA